MYKCDYCNREYESAVELRPAGDGVLLSLYRICTSCMEPWEEERKEQLKLLQKLEWEERVEKYQRWFEELKK
jgi:transcriptional regulator NrdR family protein